MEIITTPFHSSKEIELYLHHSAIIHYALSYGKTHPHCKIVIITTTEHHILLLRERCPFTHTLPFHLQFFSDKEDYVRGLDGDVFILEDGITNEFISKMISPFLSIAKCKVIQFKISSVMEDDEEEKMKKTV